MVTRHQRQALSLLPSVRQVDHVQPGLKKVVDEKSKQENNERGQAEDKEEETKSLKTDD